MNSNTKTRQDLIRGTFFLTKGGEKIANTDGERKNGKMAETVSIIMFPMSKKEFGRGE